MSKPFFSIIIPTLNRPGLARAVRSVYSQTFKDWELIIVDDGSNPPVSLGSIAGDFGLPAWAIEQTHIVRFDRRKAKLAARNEGMRRAVGRWICWLDDDDEYSCRYLEYVEKFAQEKPGMALMNFGIIRYWRGGGTDFLPIHDFKEVQFKSGLIATGTFVFKTACVRQVGYFPEVTNPTAFAKESGIPHYNGEADGNIRHMGNPWGDDFWYFRKLLEEYQSHKLNAYLYFQHIGGGHIV